MQVHPCVGNLIRVVGRLAEELLPHTRAARAAYVLGGVAPAAARAAIWLLNDVQEMNVLGIERMVSGCVCGKRAWRGCVRERARRGCAWVWVAVSGWGNVSSD